MHKHLSSYSPFLVCNLHYSCIKSLLLYSQVSYSLYMLRHMQLWKRWYYSLSVYFKFNRFTQNHAWCFSVAEITGCIGRQLIQQCSVSYNCLFVAFHVMEHFCLPPYPKSVCPSLRPHTALSFSVSHILHSFFLPLTLFHISSPFFLEFWVCLHSALCICVRTTLYLCVVLFTIYSFVVFQINLLYALRYFSP